MSKVIDITSILKRASKEANIALLISIVNSIVENYDIIIEGRRGRPKPEFAKSKGVKIFKGHSYVPKPKTKEVVK